MSLRPGQSKTVRFKLCRSDLAVWQAGAWKVVPGTYRVTVGSSSRDLRIGGRLHVR